MKRVLLLFSVLFLSNSYAQNFSQGNSLINFGVGFGTYYGNDWDTTISIPPITLQFEKFVTDDISIGGLIGYSSSEYQHYSYYTKNSYIILGGVGNYKLYDENNLNLYIGGKIGYVNIKQSNKIDIWVYVPERSYVLWGGHAGARYFISDNFALNAELAYDGISVGKIGISLKM